MKMIVKKRAVPRAGMMGVFALAVLLLTGTARAQTVSITPSVWDFGSVQIGYSQTATFSMTSVIDDDLRIFSVELLPGEDPDFDVTGFSQPIGHRMAQGSSIDFYLRFTPTLPGWHSALVTITSNDASRPIQDVTVSGRGVFSMVPEPSASLLFCTGLIGLAAAGRKKRLFK